MKIYITLLIIIGSILYANRIEAKVITVFNRLDVLVADYTTLQLAYDNASAGDTIMVYPSETPYSGIDIARKIILIGSGFTSTPNLPCTKIFGTVNFLAGSEGSVIESFGGEFDITVTGVNLISISKNSLKHVIIENSFSTLLFSNMIISGYNGTSNEGYSSALQIRENSLVEGSNNIIYGWSSPPVSIAGTSALNINNSIINGDNIYITIQGGIVSGKNNIVRRLSNGLYFDSKFSLECYYEEFQALFNDNYHLKPGTAASGTGENGADMGIYGGTTPFVDGGYPSIPIIYYLDVPLIGSQKDGINVTIKAKTNQ